MWIDKIFRSAERVINGAVDATKQDYDSDKEYAIVLGPDGKALSDKQMQRQLNFAVAELKECLDELENFDATTGGKP